MIWLTLASMVWCFCGGIAWGLVIGLYDNGRIDRLDIVALPCAFLLGPMLLAMVVSEI